MRSSGALLLAIGLTLASSVLAEEARPSAQAAKGKDARRSLALISVTAGEGFTDKQVRTIEELLLAAIDTTGRFKVIGQSDIASLLNFETRKQALGCGAADTCMAQIAGALGVDFIATADVGKLGTTTVVSLKVVDVVTASVAARAQELVADDNALPAATRMIANRVVSTLWPMSVMPTSTPGRATQAALRAPVAPRAWVRKAGWAGVVIGGLALAAGIGVGINVRSAQSKIRSEIYPGASTASLIKSSNPQAVGADALFGVGGILGAAGIGLVVAF